MPLDRKKKREERFEIENLLTSIRREFGDEVKVMEKEPPDFIVRLPDGTDIGIEATRCCPSKARGEHNNMTDYQWMEDVERMFMQNEYFREKTANYGMNILIDGSVEIRRSRNSKEECCKEIEAHLRQLLDSEGHQDQPTRLIRRVRILQGNGLSTTVKFNHIARRDAIRAKDLLKTIEKKNKKFCHYDSVSEVWLSIYLPWQENRHPYWIDYDDECTEDKFNEELAKSPFERILVVNSKRDYFAMNNEIQFILYQLPDEEGRVQVVIKDETIWATQKAMAQLFGVGVPAISKHLAHIFEEGELDRNVAVSKMETTTQHGAIEGKTQTNETSFYSLDAIIAVGYRVSSARATKFRIWATKILNEYIRKGFVLDDERLKQGKAVFGKDYFRELLERVRSIRASERRIWQQITDIYAECSYDYDRNSPTTREFYQMIQSRFHYAITGQTAPEIIFTRADHSKEHMGLQTWKNAPDGRVLLSDTKVAKNYLPEKEIRQLERAVTGYFDYIEDLIERENAFSMEQFAASVNEFLTFRRYALLPDKGKVSREEADRKAEEEYRLFNPTQRIDSDFDKELRGLFDAE